MVHENPLIPTCHDFFLLMESTDWDYSWANYAMTCDPLQDSLFLSIISVEDTSYNGSGDFVEIL